jgi:hypothetical protein
MPAPAINNEGTIHVPSFITAIMASMLQASTAKTICTPLRNGKLEIWKMRGEDT